MKIFHCDHCDHLVFFENTQCVSCGHVLAYLPDQGRIGSLENAGDEAWRSPAVADRAYRLCRNYSELNICNWTVASDDPQALCRACRLTTATPSDASLARREAWFRLEAAKRRLVYSLLNLGLPLVSKADDEAHGLAFAFVSDSEEAGAPPALTGHANGVITINLVEADDAEREKRRVALHEPYRTLLGHFRHESGHYYWDRIVRDRRRRLARFRELFGDERPDYGQSLQQYYAQGPPADWQQRYVSAYASAHAWEDWAETWAHYLHMTDTLESAAASGLSMRPRRAGEPSLRGLGSPSAPVRFERMIESWFPLTYLMNNLNRGLGLADAYPFVLSPPAIEKLRYVHDAITAARRTRVERVPRPVPSADQFRHTE